MLETGQENKDSLPDDESYDSLIVALLNVNQIDRALKYIDLTLRSGYMLSMDAFLGCVRSCVKNGRLDTLVSVIERCKVCLAGCWTIIIVPVLMMTDCDFMNVIRKWIRTNRYVLLGMHAIILQILQCNQITAI